ncbi:hypothetical protein FRC01_002944, partial [Tulasnella sp. 417]
ARIRVERAYAQALTSPPPTGRGIGFDKDDGASLLVVFRGLQSESVVQGEAHLTVANTLQNDVSEPFEAWAYQHSDRIRATKADLLEEWIVQYEGHVAEIAKFRESYVSKTRKADELEDDANFIARDNLSDAGSEKSPEEPGKLHPHATVRRTGGAAEAIHTRLQAVAERARSPLRHPPMPEPKDTMEMFAEQNRQSDGTATPTATLDKGKGKEIVSDSPTALSPAQKNANLPELSVTIPKPSTDIKFGEASLPASEVSALLFRAQQEIGVRTVKFTLLGEYEHCFTGEEFVVWLKTNVKELQGILDFAEAAAVALTQEHGVLRRIGELGNKFENSPKAFYQFRPKAFNLKSALEKSSQDSAPTDTATPSPISAGIKRSNTVVNYFVKAVQSATAPGPPEDPPHVKARNAAREADVEYRKAVRQLDEHRCRVEERIDDTLKALQRWELDRLRAVKTVLQQYQETVASLHSPISLSDERASLLTMSFKPENDLKALIEGYRTGSFRPDPKIYESITHETDSSFGIDLRKWAGEGAFAPMRSIDSMDDLNAMAPRDLPPVLVGALQALKRAYGKLPSDEERRKCWIYDVPLVAVHQLRSSVNSIPIDMPVNDEIFDNQDPPVIASLVKLWLLELNPPITLWDGWEDVKKLYPALGAEVDDGAEDRDQHFEEELKNVLIKLPIVGLKVLNVLVSHLKELVDTTTTEESNDVYVTKLALSMGRSILRPKQENAMSIEMKHVHTFFGDLIKHYDAVLPQTVERKKKEMAQRAMPVRKRTKPMDARRMRRSIDASADTKKLLEEQLALKNPTYKPNSPNTGGRPQFISPPSSPPAGGQGLPPITTTSPTDGEFVKSETQTPTVAVEPPTPVNLNDGDRAAIHGSQQPPAESAESESPDEPFTPPTASTLNRNASSEAARLRGPRVQARGGGPRPLALGSSPAGARPPPSAAAAGAGVQRPGSPRRTSAGTAASPASQRPRTPPNASDYAPSKRGGRAAAGSFSRSKPDFS